MDFDFLWKLVLTCCFMGVTICLCIKWMVECYLDYQQVMTGIRVVTLAQMQNEPEVKEDEHDPFAH